MTANLINYSGGGTPTTGIRLFSDWIAEGSECVPKICINNTTNLFLETAISVLAISNRNSSRVLFDVIASVSLYFI